MHNDYLRATVVTHVLLGFLYLTMYFGLGFVFDDHVAALLAATATWSVPVFLSAQTSYPIRLPYRRGFLTGSSFGAVMMAFQVGYLIVGARSHVFVPIAVMVLMLPVFAINGLLERILFTAEERLEINSLRIYRVP
jgi:hypothetical protein